MSPSQSLKHLVTPTDKRTPLLHCVDIRPGPVLDTAALSSTDGIIHTRILVHWRDAPRCIVPLADLKAAVKGLDDWQGNHDTSRDCHTLTVNGMSIRCIVGEELPPPPALKDDATSHPLDAVDVERCLGAVDYERSSVVLAGVLVGKVGSDTFCAATNGHILVHSGPFTAGLDVEHIAILQSGAAHAIAAYGSIGTLEVSGTLTRWTSADRAMQITSRSIDGSYPNYVQALVAKPGEEALPCASILAIISAAAQGLAKASRAVVVSSSGAGPLDTQAGGRRIRQTSDAIKAPFALNADYVATMAKLGATHCFAGRGFRFEGKGWIGIIMPVSLPTDFKSDFSDGAPLKPMTGSGPVTLKLNARQMQLEIDRLKALVLSLGGVP